MQDARKKNGEVLQKPFSAPAILTARSPLPDRRGVSRQHADGPQSDRHCDATQYDDHDD